MAKIHSRKPKGPIPIRVVKVGGREIRVPSALRDFAGWLSSTSNGSVQTIIVHGGGDEITDWADRLKMPTIKVRGQRVTPPEQMPVVAGVLAGVVNLRLVSALLQVGLDAAGSSGVSSGMVVAELAGDPPGSLGRVGRPVRVDTTLLRSMLKIGIVPVLAPIATDREGRLLNVNADSFAAAIAKALDAELILISDLPGVLDSAGRQIPVLDPPAAEHLIEDGTASGGMIPKVEAAVSSLNHGLSKVTLGSIRAMGGSYVVEGTRFVPASPVSPAHAPSPAPKESEGDLGMDVIREERGR